MGRTVVENSFREVLSLWEKMKTSHPDEASADADRFQMKFYELIEQLRDWVRTLRNPPADLESARADTMFAQLFEQMPAPLQIPFETEFELILEGTERIDDSSEQS